MRRRKALLAGMALLVLLGVILGGIRIVAAMTGGTDDTEMTKSVARITYLGELWCTGSVVGDDWVLTALHCNFTDKGPLNWHMLQVQLWQAGMNISPGYESSLSEPPLSMSNGDSGKMLYRDVMLLHVATPMPSWAKTIPTALSWPAVGTALTEYGYGRVENDQPSSALKKSQQGSIKRVGCPSGYSWSSGHICTSSSGSLPWKGDSGGPLLWWNNGYWQQVGSFSQFPPSVCPDGKENCPDNEKKRPTEEWRSYWSEADGDTRNWILSTVGANGAFGTILRDEVSGASWLYEADGYRHWIPDGGTYNCLVNNNATVLNRPLRTVEALPDKVGSWANCTLASPTPTPSPTPSPSPSPSPTAVPTVGSQPTPTPTVTSQPVNAYANYGEPAVGRAMCRGNPGNPLSMPGGTVSQTFTVPVGVASLSSALVQIDPDSSVTAHLSLAVNGNTVATADAAAAGDTQFQFGPVTVSPGDTVTLTISFTATSGKIITVYTTGSPGGMFTASNSCPDGAPNVQTTSTGLRAVVSGMS